MLLGAIVADSDAEIGTNLLGDDWPPGVQGCTSERSATRVMAMPMPGFNRTLQGCWGVCGEWSAWNVAGVGKRTHVKRRGKLECKTTSLCDQQRQSTKIHVASRNANRPSGKQRKDGDRIGLPPARRSCANASQQQVPSGTPTGFRALVAPASHVARHW